MMLSSMLKEHQREQEELKNEINTKRIIAERAVDNLTAKSVKELNDGIARAYTNQHKIDNEARKLQTNVCKLAKQTQQWLTTCNNLNGAVKDLGDITTWLNTIENDVKFVTRSVEEYYKPAENESMSHNDSQT